MLRAPQLCHPPLLGVDRRLATGGRWRPFTTTALNERLISSAREYHQAVLRPGRIRPFAFVSPRPLESILTEDCFEKRALSAAVVLGTRRANGDSEYCRSAA